MAQCHMCLLLLVQARLEASPDARGGEAAKSEGRGCKAILRRDPDAEKAVFVAILSNCQSPLESGTHKYYQFYVLNVSSVNILSTPKAGSLVREASSAFLFIDSLLFSLHPI